MHRVRIVIQHNPDDPADDLRWAARLRRDLWAHSSVEIDPDSAKHATHRNGEGNAYFEFATNHLPEVRRIVEDYGYKDRASVEVIQEGQGTECVNCGYISPELATVCPNCHFRDIGPCPYCNNEVARLNYISIAGDLFQCPICHHRVRFQFHDPLFDASGHYNQPLVRVNPAEAPVEHDV